MAGPCSPWTTGPGPRGTGSTGLVEWRSCANESLRQLCIQGGRSMVEILLGPVVPWVLLVMVSLMDQWGMHPWPWPRRQARVCLLDFFSPMKLVQDGPPYQLFPLGFITPPFLNGYSPGDLGPIYRAPHNSIDHKARGPSSSGRYGRPVAIRTRYRFTWWFRQGVGGIPTRFEGQVLGKLSMKGTRSLEFLWISGIFIENGFLLSEEVLFPWLLETATGP